MYSRVGEVDRRPIVDVGIAGWMSASGGDYGSRSAKLLMLKRSVQRVKKVAA